MQKLLGEIRRADEAYGLIQAGDRIAVGVSGGKDSMALLCLLAAYRRFAPRPFSLCALTLKIGEPFDVSPIASFCAEKDIPYTVRECDLLASIRGEKHPCALCARLRRGTLLRLAAENGANKLALGHHRDDVLETYLMSALSEGRFYALQPISLMERAGVALIRPLIDVREEALAAFAGRQHLPLVKNPCPVDGHTRRAEMKALVQALEARQPGAKDQLCAAIRRERKKAADGPDRHSGSLIE